MLNLKPKEQSIEKVNMKIGFIFTLLITFAHASFSQDTANRQCGTPDQLIARSQNWLKKPHSIHTLRAAPSLSANDRGLFTLLISARISSENRPDKQSATPWFLIEKVEDKKYCVLASGDDTEFLDHQGLSISPKPVFEYGSGNKNARKCSKFEHGIWDSDIYFWASSQLQQGYSVSSFNLLPRKSIKSYMVVMTMSQWIIIEGDTTTRSACLYAQGNGAAHGFNF